MIIEDLLRLFRQKVAEDTMGPTEPVSYFSNHAGKEFRILYTPTSVIDQMLFIGWTVDLIDDVFAFGQIHPRKKVTPFL